MTVDEGRNSRLYWADPKLHRIESILPDGTRRQTIVDDKRLPWAIDVFENHLYWASKETQNLYVQDKFGHGKVYVLASAINDVHSIRIQQRFARDVSRVESTCAKVKEILNIRLTINFRFNVPICAPNYQAIAIIACAPKM